MNHLSGYYLLTGATGIVGSHILFELLRKKAEGHPIQKIYLVIRNTAIPAQQRFLQVLKADSCPDYIKGYSIKDILDVVEIIPSDIQSLQACYFDTLRHKLTVIHCASSTNLQKTQKAMDETRREIVDTTLHLIDVTRNKTECFVYISTAFSCGIQNETTVTDNFLQMPAASYRNFYEKYKNESERLVVQQCNKYNIEWKILRPSIVCGRLLDTPFFEIPKYDVFYSWAIFLQKYSGQYDTNFRIQIDAESGLNIVPVDYVAKCIVYAVADAEIKELNIVNPKKVLHTKYIGRVLEYFSINQYLYTDILPVDMNRFENIYYKTVGALFTDYVTIPDINYDTTVIERICEELSLPADLLVEENFMALIDHAVKNDFIETY